MTYCSCKNLCNSFPDDGEQSPKRVEINLKLSKSLYLWSFLSTLLYHVSGSCDAAPESDDFGAT